MKAKLIKLSLLTSPILALYGLAPVFLFNSLSLRHFLVGFVSLTVMLMVFWQFNIYLTQKITTPLRRYGVSFTVTFLLHAFILLGMPMLYGRTNSFSLIIYPLVASLAVNAIMLVILHAVLLEQKKEMAESEIQQLKLSNLEAQKQVLLQQLQPHFLFNALSTLKSLIGENAHEAEQYSVKLSEFLRYSVQAHRRELVPLAEELQFTRDYLALQKARFGEAIRCQIDVPAAILEKQLPVFALQTLVENALKHNAFTQKKPLSITIQPEGNRLKVSNNKQAKPLIQQSGTGLANLQERYQLAAGQGLEITNGTHEFVVYLTLLD